MRVARKSKAWTTGKGSLLLIVGLMLSSAAVRLVSSAGVASAQSELASQLLQTTPRIEMDNTEEMDRPAISSLLESLRAREAAVEKAEEKMDIRAKSLSIAQREIERRLAALEETEAKLRSTLASVSTAAEDDLARLTTVYENMKPKDAAAVFEAMEPDFAAGFLARMRPDTAAKVMSGLDPALAYSISAILAGRNANAPRN